MDNKSFESIKIGLASPDAIRSWSYGEVKKPETINYRTLKPERDGLFCERIFGPTKDWECYCGKYKRIRFKGKICERCGVEVTRAKVRRERMGHIELAAPVSHIWYFKGTSSRMGLLLNLSPRVLEKVLYFASYIVIDPGNTKLKKYALLSEREYNEYREAYEDEFDAGMGAEAVKKLLQQLDIEALSVEIKEELEKATGQKKAKLLKRLDVVEAFRTSGNKPEWMILDVLPVIPPDIRPMVQLDGGRFATSDLNDLYRRVINRNNRLKKLLELDAPDIIVRNEKRMLQEAVDALIDNGRRGRPVTGPNNRALKSLSDMLKGKQGRFRQNLLGKRVDYSGRSVIVVGPELKMYQCGLPKEMALELFKPFVMKRLVDLKVAENIRKARKMVDRGSPKEVWDALEVVIKGHPVLMNRAPTLHRLGIQAFEPILVEGRALKLHPLVCTAFNADFDGDQMAVHVPLSAEAQAEARFLMLAANNLLKLSDGRPVAVPSQDMVLGSYYLTTIIDKVYATDEIRNPGVFTSIADWEKAYEANPHDVKIYRSPDEALMAYQTGVLDLHEPILVRTTKTLNGKTYTGSIYTTIGINIFNNPIPQDLGFVDRSIPGNELIPEVGFQVGKKQLSKIIDKSIKKHGTTDTSEVLDAIKSQGYKYSTRAALTVAVCDATIPPNKKEVLAAAEEKVAKVRKKYDRGYISEDDRYQQTIAIWRDATNEVKASLKENFGKLNPIYMMADSGARGSMDQINQLAGMRGNIANTSGQTIEIPIRANYREGLNILEYFQSSRGARKGLADTALRTADSGYLTRRMVDVSQELSIREVDCCEGQAEIPGMVVKAFMDGKETIEGLKDRITGRYSCEDIYDKDGNMIVKHNHMITPSRAAKILSVGVNAQGEPIEEVKIRTILTCRSHVGICAKCYGANMATGEAVQVGEAVGIIAAQSIGEPGTQLTMRTFHSGGVAGDDITQGLPRVEELFEARKPKGLAIIAEFGGKAEIRDTKKKREVVITNEETGESKAYLIPYGSRIKVMDGQVLEAGDELTEGSVNPHDLLKIKGIRAVQDYMLREVQRVYRLQGVDIADKHIEVLVRQMLKKVRIENNGDTEFLPGTLVDVLDFEEMNEKLTAEGKEPAEGKRIILGITKAALATESFLSAASFQETTKVLTEAAIKGKVDNLIGLKENVIIGKLIPVGTGMKRYRNTRLSTDDVETIDFSGDMYGDDAELNLSDGTDPEAENTDVNTDAETVEVGTDADNQ